MICTGSAAPDTVRDRIRGSLIAGAAGDALGYAVEFDMEKEIFRRWGPGGIQSLSADPMTGKAVISDDTQMTLFTAAGILDRDRAGLRPAVSLAYRAWLVTQEFDFDVFHAAGKQRGSVGAHLDRLLKIPALFACRAPGNTCLYALREAGKYGDPADLDFIAHPRNNSKGCGGVMRAAPAAWIPGISTEEIVIQAGQFAAMTHGHPLGWLPAAALAYLVRGMTFTEEPLRDIAAELRPTLRSCFPGCSGTETMCAMLDHAAALAGNDRPDLENIHALGEGWVGDEALAIALYCALRHEDDLSACLIASVNHRGDSDSTGAVAGNILGARLGYQAIDQKWKTDLELREEILELADQLADELNPQA